MLVETELSIDIENIKYWWTLHKSIEHRSETFASPLTGRLGMQDADACLEDTLALGETCTKLSKAPVNLILESTSDGSMHLRAAPNMTFGPHGKGLTSQQGSQKRQLNSSHTKLLRHEMKCRLQWNKPLCDNYNSTTEPLLEATMGPLGWIHILNEAQPHPHQL